MTGNIIRCSRFSHTTSFSTSHPISTHSRCHHVLDCCYGFPPGSGSPAHLPRSSAPLHVLQGGGGRSRQGPQAGPRALRTDSRPPLTVPRALRLIFTTIGSARCYVRCPRNCWLVNIPLSTHTRFHACHDVLATPRLGSFDRSRKLCTNYTIESLSKEQLADLVVSDQ